MIKGLGLKDIKIAVKKKNDGLSNKTYQASQTMFIDQNVCGSIRLWECSSIA